MRTNNGRVLGRRGRRRVGGAVLAAVLLAIGLPLGDAGAADEPAAVGQLKVAAAMWATFLGDLESTTALSEDLPLTTVEPGTALALKTSFGTELKAAVVALAPQGSVSALATALADISNDDDDADPATPDLTVTASHIDGSTVDGVDLVLKLTRTAPARVSLTDPDALPDGPVTVTTDAPLTITLTATAALRATDSISAGPAWLVADAAQPRVSLRATIDHDLASSPAAVGVGDLLATGPIDLDATLAGALFDPDSDGRLAFLELASDGVTPVPGEMVLTPDQLLELDTMGSASASLGLSSTLVTLGGPVALAVPTTNLATTAPVAALTGAPADLGELARFQELSAFDLLNGLTQYAVLLRSGQTHTSVDLDLPLVAGRASDLFNLAGDLEAFILAQMAALPTGSTGNTTMDDAGDIANLLKFSTVGGLAKLLEAESWTVDPVTLDYAEATDALTMGLHLQKALDAAWQPFDIPGADDNRSADAGLPRLGDELKAETSLAGVMPTNEAPARQVKTAYDVQLPMVIDLAPSTTTPACTDGDDATPCLLDDAKTAVVEYKNPMPFQRFRVPIRTTDAGAAQITLTSLLRVPQVAAEGRIGFVPVSIVPSTSTYELGQDGTNPTTSARFRTVVGIMDEATPRIGKLLATLNFQEADPSAAEDTTKDPVSLATRKGVVKSSLALRAHGHDPADALLPTDGVIGVNRTFSTTTGVVLPPHSATVDATVTTLRRVDIEASEPAALLGRFLDSADIVSGALEDINDTNLVTEIPLIGASAGDLLNELVPLGAKLDEVRTGPTPGTLADLEAALQTALGIGEAGLTWDLLDVDGQPGVELVARFDIDKAFADKVHPASIDLGPLGELTAGGLTAGVAAGLDIGIVTSLDATVPGGFPTVLKQGGFTAGARLQDQSGDFELEGQLGPFSVKVGDAATDAARVNIGVDVTADVNAPAATAITPAAWVSALTSGVSGPSGGASCTPAITGAPAVSGVLGCLSAPVAVNGAFPGGGAPDAADFMTVKIDSLTGAPTVSAPALQTVLDAQPLSFASLGDGLASLRQLLSLAVKAGSFGSALPVVGDDIAAGTELLGKFDTFLNGLSVAEPGATSTVEEYLYGPGGVRDTLATKLVAAGGVLRDSDYTAPAGFGAYYDPADHTPGAKDIRVVAKCGAANCLPTATMNAVTEVTFELELGQGDRTPDTDGCDPGNGTPCSAAATATLFELGLEGLPLHVDGGLTSSAGWTLELGFGISREDGFFLLDNPLPGTNVPDAGDGGDELRLGASVSLTQVAGDELKGRLGFFEVGLEDTPAGGESAVSTAKISASMGLEAPGDRITLGGLLTGDITDAFPTPDLSADVALNLRLQTGIDGGTDLDQVTKLLPKITADFVLDWAFSTAGESRPLTVGFGNVGLDVSTLFSSAVGELMQTIDHITDPVDPVREFLFAPIPVISDLSRLFGGGDVTFVDLAETFGDVNLSLLKDINALLDFIKTLSQAADGTPIPIGSFSVPAAAAKGPEKTPDQADDLTNPAAGVGDITATLKSELADDGNLGKFDEVGDDDDLDFPFLEQPQCVFDLLMGGDCSIMEWRPDVLSVEFEYEQSFGPFFGVLYVTIGGYAEARANLGVGFSTRGIRILAEDILDGGTTYVSIPDLFLQSIYLTDYDTAGNDIDELSVKAGLTAGGKVSIVIAAAGVRGGVEASMALNWHDGGFGSGGELDGKIYIDEAIAKIATPLCLFDISGRLRAFLEVYAEFGVCPFCYEESFELASITLLEFTSSCPNTQPVNAKLSGDDLVLNVGDDAGDRGTGWNEAVHHKENYVVRQLTPADSNGYYTFSVTAFGHTQRFVDNKESSGVLKAKRVTVKDAADQDDSFLFQGVKFGSQNGQDLAKGDKDDKELAPFQAQVTINSMGSGNDNAATGNGNDTVNGGSGNDGIDLGDGDDTANGNGGNDAITGGRGVDTLNGGDNEDTVDGGLGGDHLFGDAGHDRLQGGADFFKVPGVVTEFDGGDDLHGGTGNDTIDGGSGNDTMYGDEDLTNDNAGANSGGADRITGHGGEDTVFAGNGADLVVGGYSDPSQGDDDSPDHLHGNGGADRMYGRDGNDNLWGGAGADELDGEGDEDQVHGQGGNDPLVRGGHGNDDLSGGSGEDTVLGDGGHDDLTGDGEDAPGQPATPGKDTLDGGDGDDIVLGDNGTVDDTDADPPSDRKAQPSESVGVEDTLRGGPGEDRLYGEGGPDHLYGGEGADLLHGNDGVDDGNGENGDDEIWGDADGDVLNGGPQDDLIFGNGGKDFVYGQPGDDDIIGGSKTAGAADEGDLLYGQDGEDRIYGDNVTINSPVTALHAQAAGQFGGDLIDGGNDQDEGRGQDGVDTLYGGIDHDQLYGDYDGDTLYGQDGPDHLFGDRGSATPFAADVVEPAGGWVAGTPKGSPVLTTALEEPGTGGIDLIWGGAGDDHEWGGTANDILHGEAGDDYAEGNDGQDEIYGEGDEDDLLGGSSPVNPLADPPGGTNTAGAPDVGELIMKGGDQEDVMTGDNAVVTRVPNQAGTAWKTDPVTGGAERELTLLDTEESGATLAAVSGGDLMEGNRHNDRMFGEGGNDRVKGNEHDDLVEGNQGADWLEGNDGEDDVIGGSSFPDQPDEGDLIHGGGGADALAGDNACIVRKVTGVVFTPASCEALDTPAPSAFHYVTTQLGIDTQRGIVLHDLDGPVATEFGADQMSGGSGVDVELGQDGQDFLSGGGGADYQQGNGHADVLLGDQPLSVLAVPQSISLPPQVGGTLPVLPGLPVPAPPGSASAEPALSGVPEADGQDDQIGGSNFPNRRDAGDWLFGDGEADFQLGDNGMLDRTIVGTGGSAAYDVYEERYPGNTAPADAVIVRTTTRFDAGTAAGAGIWGADLLFGGDGRNPLISKGAGDGDDSQWGQDGNDQLFGEDENDDQYGELGDDRMWGGDGEDAMVGDRGGIVTRFVEADGSDAGDPEIVSHKSLGPPGIGIDGVDSGDTQAVLNPFKAHPLDRRVSLSHDRDGTVLPLNGNQAGGNDQMRGGPGHDALHGADGDDYANGDSGGDYVYGNDGADVLWGGRGNPDDAFRNNPGAEGEWIDVTFGGFGASNTEAGADIIDYQPRAGVQPDQTWAFMTLGYADIAINPGDVVGVEARQHHHGIDWQYGGWDRDVMQGDVAANGPNDGDKMLDWNGAYNLYTHCNAAYGGWNDVRKIDPNNVIGLEKLAHVTGAADDHTGRATLADVQKRTSSANREVAIVYTEDLKHNSGRAFSSTPGHFEDFICTSD